MGFPIVNVSSWLEDAGVPSVRCDQEGSGRICAEHLLARGFRRFGVVRLWGGWYVKARMEGFLKRVEEAGYGGNVSFFEQQSPTMEISPADLKKFQAWVSTLRPPVGLLLTDDQRPSAQQVMNACCAERLRIPQDVAVIAAHRHPERSVSYEPPMSHVDWAEDTVALEAARYLDCLMNGAPPTQRTIYVPPKGVVALHSTDTLAVDDPLAARAIEFIRAHSGENINGKVVADQFSLCRRTLDEHFVGATGMSIYRFLIRERIQTANDFLRSEPALSLGEIASRCGFFDARHMKRVLKRDGASGWSLRQS